MHTTFQASLRSPNFMETFFPPKDRSQAQVSGLRRVRRGECIFQAGDEANCVYFVVEGKVKISALSEEQKEVTKGIFGGGDLFGEQAIVSDGPRRDQAVALQDTLLRVLSAQDMLLLLHGRHDLMMLLMQLVASRQQHMEQRLESLVFRDSRSRVVECLVHLTAQKGQRVGYEWVLHKPITHQEIANLTATSRQTVTTTLNDLQYSKILTFNRKRLLIRDLDRLKAEIKF